MGLAGGVRTDPLAVARSEDVSRTYDHVADEYVRRIYHELDDKPFDRELLDRFAERVRNAGAVWDVGCGPGHVTRYLHERGVEATGIDLSPKMVERARELNPGIAFRTGDMRKLEAPDRSLAGVIAFYSLIHIEPDGIPAVLRELHRTLMPGAPLLIAFHLGDEPLHRDEWWGHSVSIDFYVFDPEWMKQALVESGFRIAEAVVREPYPEVEHQSRRGYITAETW